MSSNPYHDQLRELMRPTRQALIDQAVRNVRKDPLAAFLPVLMLGYVPETRYMAYSTINKICDEFRRLEKEHG